MERRGTDFMKHFFRLIAFIIVYAYQGNSQSLFFHGNILRDYKHNNKQCVIKVYGLGENDGMEFHSNIDGSKYEFRINKPKVNFLNLTFKMKNDDSKIAYLSIDIQNVDTINSDIFFSSFDKILDEVVVSEKTNKNISSQRFMRDVEGTMIFAGKKSSVGIIENALINKATNNTRQLFKDIAGITIQENNESGLQLNIGARGLNPNRSANFSVRQNGYDISADPLGYPESYYTPNSDDIKEIQVLRGASALSYGSQFGGMINFILSKPSDKKFDLRQNISFGSFGFLGSYTRISGTYNKKISYYISSTLKKSDGYRPNSDFKSYNILSQFEYNPNHLNSLHIDLLKYNYIEHQPGGLTDVMFHENPYQSNRSRNWFFVDWNILSLMYKKIFEKNNSELNIYLNGLYARRFAIGYRNNRVSTPDPENVERDLQRGIFRNWSSEIRYLSRFTLPQTDISSSWITGIKYYQSINDGEQGPGTASNDADFTIQKIQENSKNLNGKIKLHSSYVYPNFNLAFFSEASLKFNSRFTIVPGIRLETIKTGIKGNLSRYNIIYKDDNEILQHDQVQDNIVKNRFIILGGLSSSYKSSNFEIYANITRNYRAITFNDMRVVSPGLEVNPDLKDETGFSSDIGIRSRRASFFSYDMSVFCLYYGNRIGEYYRENPKYPGSYHRYRDNIGDGISYGIEGNGNLDLSGITKYLHHDIKADLFANVAITDSRYISGKEMQHIKGNKIEFVPLYNLKGGINLGVKNFSASFQINFVSFQFTDATNEPMNPDDSVYGIYGAIPGYTVMDCNLSYNLSKYLRINVALQNIGNEKYITRRATGYPGPGIIPSVPFNFISTIQIQL